MYNKVSKIAKQIITVPHFSWLRSDVWLKYCTYIELNINRWKFLPKKLLELSENFRLNNKEVVQGLQQIGWKFINKG